MNNGALTRDQRERYDIALARYNADLLDVGADEADSKGQTRIAGQKREMAAYLRANADNLEQFRANYRFDDPNRRTRTGRAPKTAFHVERRLLRDRLSPEVRALFTGNDIRFDFPQPTPAELGLEF